MSDLDDFFLIEILFVGGKKRCKKFANTCDVRKTFCFCSDVTKKKNLFQAASLIKLARRCESTRE